MDATNKVMHHYAHCSEVTTSALPLYQDGLTALMVATSKNYEEIVDALVRGGANVNHPHAVKGNNVHHS